MSNRARALSSFGIIPPIKKAIRLLKIVGYQMCEAAVREQWCCAENVI